MPHEDDASLGPLTGLAFGQDGTSLLLCRRGEWAFWEVPAWHLRDHCSTAGATAALAPDGSVLATTDTDGVLQLWDLQTRRLRRPAGQRLWPVTSLAYSPDGRALLTGSRAPSRVIHADRRWGVLQIAPQSSTRETVRLWDPATGHEDRSALADQLTLAAPAVVAGSATGNAVAAGAEDGSVWVWDGPGHGSPTRLFLSPWAEVCARGNEVARWLCPESNPEYARYSERVTALAFAPDGRWLAAAGTRGSLRVWAADGWQPHLALRGDPGGVAWVGFTADSKRVAASWGGQVRFWEVSSGQPGTTFGAEDDAPVLGGAFAPGGGALAAASKDGSIRFWDLATGKLTALLVGHQAAVTSLAFTADGKTLASGSWDRSVRLWSVAASREVALLEGHAGKVQAVAFAPDGRALATGSDTGEVLLWRADRR
jgi:WD40 repeat protein